jgi:hypothetical protein
MKPHHLIACAAFALAACGQSSEPAPEAAPEPQGLMEQAQRMSG